MTGATAYNEFFRHYDAVMGDRKGAAHLVEGLIEAYHPKARTVLELACGTGAVLQHLETRFQTSGLDISEPMLSQARNTLKRSRLYNQDMARFDVEGTFDVIFCVFDSINHLTRFADWRKVFARAARRLNDDGLFIFDINTEHKLQGFVAAPPSITEFDGNFMIMDIRAGRNGITHWNVKVFERTGVNRFKLCEETIRERSFPVPQIRAALKHHFKKVVTLNSTGQRTTSSRGRLFFVCRK